MSDHVLDRPGARLAYDVSGPDNATRTVIVAHGLGYSRANEDASGFFDWSPVASAERLIRYDARGHGRSGGRKEEADYAWPVLAEDFLALADAVSPDAAVDVVGTSMGVGTALWGAIRRPERLRR